MCTLSSRPPSTEVTIGVCDLRDALQIQSHGGCLPPCLRISSSELISHFLLCRHPELNCYYVITSTVVLSASPTVCSFLPQFHVYCLCFSHMMHVMVLLSAVAYYKLASEGHIVLFLTISHNQISPVRRKSTAINCFLSQKTSLIVLLS